MNFKHLINLQESIDGMKKIFSIAWSPNLLRLAVAHVDEKRNVRISLFDENGERKETFPTRAANKSNKSYVVRDIAFSPDSIKLAVSQSDNIVFIYNLGKDWGDKKTICNKFEQNTQVTVMIWPNQRANEIYFGVAEGKVKMGMLKTNSAQILYSTDSYVVAMSFSPDGKFLLTGHLDSSVYKYNFESTQSTKIIQSDFIPYCLSCGLMNHILIAGNDTKVIIYSENGDKIQNFDYNHLDKIKDFTLSRINTHYDTIAIGNFDRFFIFMYNQKKNQWEEAIIKNIENYYTVTALIWKPEVNTLVTGSLCGSIDIFESCLKKSLYNEKFEIIYISLYQVMIKNLETGRRATLKSNISTEILKLSIHMDNYVIINTKESIILADLNNQKISEIIWTFTGNEKYDFSNLNVCMIYHLGEITLIEYGNNEVVGYCRTEYIHPNLVSARIINNTKLIAYLIDPFTIYIQDLNSQNIILNYNHDKVVEFIDFNRNGNKLLFRDNNRHLFLYSLNKMRKMTLLNFCSFVQWVPGAEVLVAQDRKNMIIWYNIEDLDNFKTISIKGEIEEVRRANDRSEVFVEEAGETVIYLLEENLIRLSNAIEQSDLSKAVSILESLSIINSSDYEIYWKSLSKIAILHKNLFILQRCFAAVGAYSKTNYIKKIMKDVDILGIDHPVVLARLFILDKQFIEAENILVNNKLITEAISIFNEIHRYEVSLSIAEKYNIPELKEIQDKYDNFLMDNQLFDKAAEQKIKEGNLLEGIRLYMQGDFYIKAANLITREKVNVDKNVIEIIMNKMKEIGVYEKVSEIYEYLRDYENAIQMYIKANNYPKAIEIARFLSKGNTNNSNNNFNIKSIEEMWGDYLTTQRQIEMSVSHYIDAARFDKAIEALITSRKWEKATELCDKIKDENLINNFYIQIADHHIKEKNYDMAEKLYLKSANFIKLIELYILNKKWEKLELFLEKNNSTNIKNQLIQLGMKYSDENKHKEAERLYLIANEPDLAINMYKNIKQYDEMINLVEIYMPDYLTQSIMMICQLLESENNLKSAEKFYIKNKMWKNAIDMYFRYNMTEECLVIANSNAENTEDFLNIFITLFKDDFNTGKQFLLKLDIIEHCIKFLCFNNNFEEAAELAKSSCKEMLPFVYLRFGIEMKDQNNLEKAEDCFILANEPREAILMYLDKDDFNNALRISRTNCEEIIPEIYFKQGMQLIKKGELEKSEICLIKANRPEIIFQYYLDNFNKEKAFKFAEKYAPHLLIHTEEDELSKYTKDEKLKYILLKCQQLEKNNQFPEAIENYLQIPQNEIKDKNILLKVYQKVLDLSKFCIKDFRIKVIDVLSRKYLSLEEFKLAGDILITTQNYEEAINCYLLGNHLNVAKDIINGIENETNRDYLQNIINKKLFNNNQDNFDDLITQGKYEECLIKLEQNKTEIFYKYLIKISSQFFINRQFLEFANLLLKIDFIFDVRTISILQTLSLEILAEENLEELESLKLIFEKHEDDYNKINEYKTEISRLHKITHFQFIKLLIKEYENKFPELLYNISICVLQYGDVIKSDLAIYDAIKICNKLKKNGNSFLLTCRYLDLYEYIEFGGELEEMEELRITNIPQKDVFLSANNVINITMKEELNKWISNKTIDKNFNRELIMVNCIKCNQEIFEANLECNNCHYQYEQCIISGFPIRELDKTFSCKHCERSSIDKFWNQWNNLFHYCPWCRTIYN